MLSICAKNGEPLVSLKSTATAVTTEVTIEVSAMTPRSAVLLRLECRPMRHSGASEQALLVLHPRDPRPGDVVHEHPRPPVDRGRAEPLEGRLVAGAGVALVQLEVVAREVGGLAPHDAVPGDLGQDRGGGDRQAGGVALDQAAGAAAAADEVPVAVDEHVGGLEAEAGGG